MITRRDALLLGAGLLAAGCAPTPSTTPTDTPTPSATPSATPIATATPSATPTLTPTTTPDPYAGRSIASLRQETWGTGSLRTTADLGQQAGFHRYRIAFDSDDLAVDGFMNVPDGPGPFPVLLVLHGYVDPDTYELLTYTTPHADAFARAGFLVLHPSYRNHRGSDDGPNPFRIGHARDVMHLTTLARGLPQADGGPVSLWGHSMGGGIALRALAIRGSEYRRAVLYGAMSADEAVNYRKIQEWIGQGKSRRNILDVSPEEDPGLYAAMSPINFLSDLRVPLQLHHGELDEQVPLAWSQDLDARLTSWGVPHELFVYPGSLHNVAGAQLDQLLTRCVQFLRV